MTMNINFSNVKILQEIKSHTSDITCVEFLGNSLLFTGSSDKTVRSWKWIAGQGFIEEDHSPFLGHKYGVTCIRISPQGGVLASASVDGSIILWDISKGSKTNVLNQEAGEAVRSCAFSPDGSCIVSSDDSGAICVWAQNKTMKNIIRNHEEAVHTLAFSSDSNILLSACTLGNVRLFLAKDLHESAGQTINSVCSIDCAHDLGVLSADFCKLIHTDPTDNETSIYTIATCGTDHLIKVWRIFFIDSLKRKTDRTRLVPKSPQEHISGTSTIYCTETMNAGCVLTIPAHGSSVTCVRFNNPGTLIISSGMDKFIKIWDLQGNCLKTLSEHSRYVNCVTINNDSTIIVSGSNDRKALVWDLTGNLTIDSHIAGLRSLLFNLAANQSEVPQEFICPITHEIMRSPVIVEDGFTYERSAILEWFGTGKNTSPMTNIELNNVGIMDNTILQHKIEAYLKAL